VDHILAECNRLNRMVENILDLSRVESERLFLHRTRRDLISFLSEVAREMSITPGARPVELDLPSGELVMELDWDKMKQVLINLLDNAFRFSPDGERVKVSVAREDDSVVVKVADRGPGVPREDRERLFDKFTQRKGEGMEKGLGLGLYIVRTFVEAHGGRVWVEDGVETGAVFAFSLPLRGEGG
jgi:signal transduction histidine kinase